MSTIRHRMTIVLASALAGLNMRQVEARIMAEVERLEAEGKTREEAGIILMESAQEVDLVQVVKRLDRDMAPVIATHEVKPKQHAWERPRFDHRKMTSMKARSRR